MTRPIILAYDGSKNAKHAITTAGELLHGHAVVVHVYATPQPPAALAPSAEIAQAIDPAATEELDQRAREQATSVVQEGVDLAREAGFDPEAELVAGDGVHGVWNAIVTLADQRDASLIVVGHRDLSWIQDKLLGSVASDLVKHTTRPVLVIPAEPE